MKKVNLILKKCKSLSRQLGRTSSYSNLRSKSTREEIWGSCEEIDDEEEEEDFVETIYVGSSRKRYLIKSKHLKHPLLNALIEKSKKINNPADHHHHHHLTLKCEVVLFDHLLWMLDNADPDHDYSDLQELADLYLL
ncbi:hypothetical protein M9H77_14946 [Catharanthus roseus]|uniref:Uncharacterized protein n=1 Tax=Catharanthus roseus TaxID=4058 RepID=A0ACC0BPP3_CATRO|nr:hypothetical protein M9H77_14946 [Catharanthus roseus]